MVLWLVTVLWWMRLDLVLANWLVELGCGVFDAGPRDPNALVGPLVGKAKTQGVPEQVPVLWYVWPGPGSSGG